MHINNNNFKEIKKKKDIEQFLELKLENPTSLELQLISKLFNKCFNEFQEKECFTVNILLNY